MLGFYTPENPLHFRLMQYGDELLIRKDFLNEKNRLQTVELELEHVFLDTEPLTFIITSGASGTVAYRNGVQVGVSTHMKLLCADLAGQLVIGDSPITHNSWRGNLLDLAIYHGDLTPQEASRASAQSNQPGPSLTAPALVNGKIIARYAFTDGSGKIIRNSAGSAPDLLIPDHFRTLHRQVLVWPWQETSDKLELRDIAINILGFVPFGLLLSAYLRINHSVNRTIFLTVMAGFAISLTIEVLQVFIPSRGSGILDIFTNTLGTYLGVLLLQAPATQNLAAKLRLYPPRADMTRQQKDIRQHR
ncbi:MAG: VanZ family protein [Acidobacteriota bacterium]|nr:VanZ family protein [Acidobacteriota bacterium]